MRGNGRLFAMEPRLRLQTGLQSQAGLKLGTAKSVGQCLTY